MFFPGEIISFGSCCLADIYINGAMFPDSAIGSREIGFFAFSLSSVAAECISQVAFSAHWDKERSSSPLSPHPPQGKFLTKRGFFAPYKTPFIPFVTAGAGGEGSRVAKRRRRRRRALR